MIDYLKAFIIGTSGPVYIQHLALLALRDTNYADYPFKEYSLVAPLYYGLMSMLALYLGNTFGFSLQKRLFIISIISICFVVTLAYFVFRKFYKPYKNYTIKDWLSYVILNGGRHLIGFNLIIYYFTKFFSTSWPLRIFIIGSSFISYFITYLKVMFLDYKNKLNYDFKTFAVGEPFIQGFDLLAHLYILQKILGFGLQSSMCIWAISSSIIWLLLATIFKTYKYTNIEWISAFIRIILTSFFKAYILYHVITKLK